MGNGKWKMENVRSREATPRGVTLNETEAIAEEMFMIITRIG